MAEQTMRWVFDKDGQGQGGFLAPPGHTDHSYVVKGYRGKRREPDVYAGIGSVLDSPDEYPDHVVRRAKEISDRQTLNMSDLWVRMVYGYMRSMYLAESGSTAVSDMVSDPTNSLPAERHAAVAYVRRYFPDHEARLDLIADPGKGYGSYPCAHCGERVQYEARIDALAVFGRADGHVCQYSPDGAHRLD